MLRSLRRSVEAADAALAANVEDYRDVMVALYAEVASSYVDARSFQARLDFARANVESQRDSLELTRDRFDAGPLVAASYVVALRPAGFDRWTWAFGTENGADAGSFELREGQQVDLGAGHHHTAALGDHVGERLGEA